MADLYASDHHGIYIPQFFARSIRRKYVEGVSDDDWATLEAGPDHEHYWSVWSDVLDSAKIKSPNGDEGFLWQDGDLWIIWGETDPDYNNLIQEI